MTTLGNVENIKVGSTNIARMYEGNTLVYYPLPPRYQQSSGNGTTEVSQSWSGTNRTVTLSRTGSTPMSVNKSIRLMHQLDNSHAYTGPGRYRVSFTATKNSPSTHDVESNSFSGSGNTNPETTKPLFLSYRDDDEYQESPDYLNKEYEYIVNGSNSYVVDMYQDDVVPRSSINIIVHRQAQLHYVISDISITYLGPLYQLFAENLVLWIDAENSLSYSGSGNAITNLAPGTTNNATLSNAVFNSTTPKNWEVDEDAGTGDHDSFINFGDVSDFDGSNFTFSIWFEFTNNDLSGNDGDIISKGPHGTSASLLVWYDAAVSGSADVGGSNTETISFFVGDGTSAGRNWISAPSGSIEKNKVYNLVVQATNTGRSRIWINGVMQEDSTKSSVSGMANNSEPLKLGAAQAAGSSAPLDSDIKIYAFHAYDSFLTDAQIDLNWNNLRGRFGL